MTAVPRLLIAPFIEIDAPRNAEAVATAVALLRVAAIFQIFDASQATLASMLRGLHDSRWPLVIALAGYWAISAPIGVALGFAARSSRRLDRTRLGTGGRGRPVDDPLARQRTAGFSAA
jgi:Na+-driven multidrug efflux pump